MSDSGPYSIPPELKAELIHFFAEADRKNAERFDSVKAEVRAERELRQRESQRLTALEHWRDEVSGDIKSTRAEVKQLRGEYAGTHRAVTEMSDAVTKLTAAVEGLGKRDVEHETEFHRIKLTLKFVVYFLLAGGAGGGVAKALSLLAG